MEFIKEWFGFILAGIGALIGALYAQLTGRQQKAEVNIGKLFDQFQEHEREDAKRHSDILEKMNSNHLELLGEIRGRRR